MIARETIFSADRVYRYTLWRDWDTDALTGCSDDLPHAKKFVQFIGLNPSTADETQNDPTVTRCIGFAQRLGFGAMCMTNLFAYRSTDPKLMKRQLEPVGSDNDTWLYQIARSAGMVIAAWGTHGTHRGRAEQVKRLIPVLRCLRKTKGGHPEHPLYIPYDIEVIDL